MLISHPGGYEDIFLTTNYEKIVEEGEEMGTKIKEYLDANGIKQAFLVERTGLSADKISGICTGKRNIDCVEYYKICKALNLDLEYFFKDLEVE